MTGIFITFLGIVSYIYLVYVCKTTKSLEEIRREEMLKRFMTYTTFYIYMEKLGIDRQTSEELVDAWTYEEIKTINEKLRKIKI